MQDKEIVIIGSGLGGLACGTIMAMEGYRVTVLEKNKQIGGMLQTFVRDKVIFDTGIHYVGGLSPGQNLHRLFTYLGIMDKLKLRKMDQVFDEVMIDGDPTRYGYAQGYDNFVDTLSSFFPDDRKAIQMYCDKMREICAHFPLYNLEQGGYREGDKGDVTDTRQFIDSLTENKKLRAVLAGTSLLYAGEPDKTPLHVHALIVNHYIESSWKFVDGGSQIARLLAREITSRSGKVIKHVNVTSLREEGGRIVYAEGDDGTRYKGDIFISNVHPVKTLEMTDSEIIRNVYRERLKGLENTMSVFYVNVVLKKESLKYVNRNLYVLEQVDAWCAVQYEPENWPQGYAVFFNAISKDATYTDGITIMAYMRTDEVAQWAGTFNTVDSEESRGESYEAFKRDRAEKLFDAFERKMPGFKATIQSYSAATPLTARDYIGTDDGSLYGFAKDFRDPIKTTLSARTRIPNLLFTGQNVNLHGVLGVTLSSVVTCAQILGMDHLVNKIKNA